MMTPTPGVSVTPSELPFMKDPDNTLPILGVVASIFILLLIVVPALRKRP